MGSDSHPRILRLSPPVSRRIDYLHHSRIFRHILKKTPFHGVAELEERVSIPQLGQSSVLYALFRTSLETGLLSLPVKGRTSFMRNQPLSCGHHPAAFRVIPSFQEGVY